MSKKSKTYVVNVSQEDPATNKGIIAIYEDCVKYLPSIDGRKQKTIMHGDQGFFEKGYQVTYADAELIS